MPKTSLVPARIRNEDAAESYVQWMATPEDERTPPTKQEFAKYLGIARDTLYRWENTEWFQQAVRREAKKWLASRRRDVYQALIDQAIEEQNIAAIRHYSQLMGDQVQKIDVKKTEESVDTEDVRKMDTEELVKRALEEHSGSEALKRRLDDKDIDEEELREIIMVMLDD